MASRFSDDDLSCPVCFDVYKDPVVLTCSHSVCKACLQQFWTSKGSKECPLCRRRCSREIYPRNLVLKNLCETFQQKRDQREPFCSLHRSELKLFCEDDKQLVCLVCRDSKLHKNHNFRPIPESAFEHKEELKIKLQPLQKKLDNFTEAKMVCDETVQYIQVQAQHTERQIKEEFEKLHQFLRDEEAARIAALREEEEQKSQMMKDTMEKMSREISFLSETIRVLEAKIRGDDITLLQDYQCTVERAQCTLQDPERVSGALINVANHLGNLKFRVWEKMQAIVSYTPVILDSNTAHPCLILSEDLTSVKFVDVGQQLPNNPERFDRWINVLGSEGLKSGIHCWDVQVGNNSSWDMGVVTESARRKGKIDRGSGVLCMFYGNGKYSTVSSPQPEGLLKVKQKPCRVRMQLDWDGGKVSLYDLDNNTHLHTFTHTFTERVFPFFGSLCTCFPLRILPLKTSVRIIK